MRRFARHARPHHLPRADPLLVYLYRDGLARFASAEFNTDKRELTNNCVHLTNSAVNKLNTHNYGADNADPFSGHLWTLGKYKMLTFHSKPDLFFLLDMLMQYLSTYTTISWDVLWESITDVVR